MIIEGIVRMLTTLVKGVLDLLPSSNPPGWFMSAGDAWSGLMAQVGLLGTWMPVTLATNVTAAILGSMGVGFAIKVVRLVVSYFTAGGGSAA